MAYEKIVSVASTATSGQVPQADGVGGFNWGNVEVPESGVQIDLLWENASPTSAFAAQTIELDLSGNPFVGVDLSNGESAWLRVGESNSFFYALLPTGSSTSLNRDMTVSESGVTFSVTHSSNVYNQYLVPRRIYRIKGVTTA